MPDTILTVGDGVSRPNNTIRLHNVSGENIVFRNFRGRPTPVTKGGDRSFCLIIPNRLVRDQLAARGCNIKKLKDKDIEFVNVAVRITPYKDEAENIDSIWTALDIDEINTASLEFTFYEYNINGRKGTRIYLKNASFCVKDLFEKTIIDIRWPNTISVTNSTNNTNNAEETNMEKIMSVEEIISRFGVLEYVYNSCKSEDKKALKDIMEAVRAAKYYLVPKMEDKPRTDKPMVTGYELEKAGGVGSIKQVIFNDLATIVVWWDDVKTVVKCQEGDTFDKEKGLAMAICKRLYGNKSNFNNLIKKWTEPKTKKAERQAQAEANKTAKGKSKTGKKKALNKARKNVKDTSNVVITDAYANHVRVKMAKRGIKSYNELAKICGVSQTTLSRSFGNAKRKSRVIYRTTFNKINKALGIRWG